MEQGEQEVGTREDIIGAWLLADTDQEGPLLVAHGLQSVQSFRARDSAEEPPAGWGHPEQNRSPQCPSLKSQPPPDLTLCLGSQPKRSYSLTLTDPGYPSLPTANPKCPKWPILDTRKGLEIQKWERPPTTLPGASPVCGDRTPHPVGAATHPQLQL